ncbi:MAG: hypothetical protein QM776_15205 [Rhodocyclaceae bacterium]
MISRKAWTSMSLNCPSETKQHWQVPLKPFPESNDLYTQTKALAEVIGTTGVTFGYQGTAAQETKAANAWRGITIGIFLIGITIAIQAFQHWDSKPDTNALFAIIVKLLFAIAITTPAFYTARESARHRTTADRARQSALELEALGPFIETMSDEAKLKVRNDLIPKYFGNSNDPHTIAESASVMKLLDIVQDAVKATGKKG